MLKYKSTNTSVKVNHQMGTEASEAIEKERYQWLAGKLVYLSHTRPHIGYAIIIVSPFMHDPRTSHLEAVHRILRYLKFTLEKVFYFPTLGI